MKRKTCVLLAFFIALHLFTWVVPASAGEEDDWDNLTATLGLENPAISKGEYMLEVLKFDCYGMVWVQVLKNGVVLDDAVLEGEGSGWSYMDGENIRLKACNVTDQTVLPMFGSLYCPKAEIVFETKKHVESNVSLGLDLDTDKSEYYLDEEVIVEMELRNTGEVKAENLRLELDSDGLQVREGVPEKLTLSKGSAKQVELKFSFPNAVKETYNVTVHVYWEDDTGSHSLFQTEEIELSELYEVYKYVDTEAFTGSPVSVTVSVDNFQPRSMKVSLLDLLPATFTLINASGQDEEFRAEAGVLSWDIELGPEEHRAFSYYISSGEAGAHGVPQAHVYGSLGGRAFAKSSDIENVIRVYENVSYREYNAKDGAALPSTEVEEPDEDTVSIYSGEDFSGYLDENGSALLDIFVWNEDLKAFVYIPEGTRIEDGENCPLSVITVTENDSLPLDSGLTAAGEGYEIGPEDVSFSPCAFPGYYLKEPASDIFSIYLYQEGSWVYANSIYGTEDGEGSVLTPVEGAVIYRVVYPPSEVIMKVNVK